MSTFGFIGAGRIGSALARLAIEAGHKVALSNRRGPEALTDLVAELGPRARATIPAEAAEAGDLVVVTIPDRAICNVPTEPLRGKIDIDTNYYYPERDGSISALGGKSTTTSTPPGVPARFTRGESR